MPDTDRNGDPSHGAPSGVTAHARVEIAPEDRARLASRFGRRFSCGDALFRSGEPADTTFLLQEGRVRLVKRTRDSERSMAIVKPGELFGESALLEGVKRVVTALALTDGVALALDRPTFQSLLERHPALAGRVIGQLVQRLRETQEQLELSMLVDAPSKVARALLTLARSAPRGEINVTPLELASFVGLEVGKVKRQVQRFREQGYVRITGEKMEIPEIDALEKLLVLLTEKEKIRADGR